MRFIKPFSAFLVGFFVFGGIVVGVGLIAVSANQGKHSPTTHSLFVGTFVFGFIFGLLMGLWAAAMARIEVPWGD